MQSKKGIVIIALWLLTGCYSVESSFAHGWGKLLARPLECVPYARKVSGIELYGDAHSWWDKAPQKDYARGYAPKPGAVLVLAKTSRLHYGHVAVVQKIIDRRQIEVTHVNWGRDIMTKRTVYKNMRVIDVSANNDWTQTRFWSPHEGGFGRIYPASGFVYSQRPWQTATR